MVEKIKALLEQVGEEIANAMNSIKVSMDEKIEKVKELRVGIEKDAVTLTEIGEVVETFAEDLDEFADDIYDIAGVGDEVVSVLSALEDGNPVDEEEDFDPADFIDEDAEVAE